MSGVGTATVTRTATTTPAGRMGALARAELTLLGRTKGTLFAALFVPLAMPFSLSQVADGMDLKGNGLSMGAVVVPGAIGFSLLFAVYSALTTVFTARREELVLKRLRTGELRDPEILAGAALPSVAIGLTQCVVLAIGCSALLDAGAPSAPHLAVIGVLLGLVMFSALAAVTASFSRSVESAQVMAMPLTFASMFGSGLFIPFEVMPDKLGFAAVGVRDGRLVAAALVIAFGTLVSLLSSRCGAWTLSVMWEADRAREVEARLAVAEERLRFGRDLHDVMGRNLAVIALKSELAVQLAKRGRPEAVDQMVEVQRIAQESQREVREVVRGYREADLAVELAGAQGVLEAAGIDCRVSGSSAGLPVSVQSALGWVVREATTNVLRHGDAQRCDITLTITAERTSLVVENDGVPDAVPEGRKGSGLAGLRERLAAVDGTLDFSSGDGRFRLAAEVPPARPRQHDPHQVRQQEAEKVSP